MTQRTEGSTSGVKGTRCRPFVCRPRSPGAIPGMTKIGNAHRESGTIGGRGSEERPTTARGPSRRHYRHVGGWFDREYRRGMVVVVSVKRYGGGPASSAFVPRLVVCAAQSGGRSACTTSRWQVAKSGLG